MFIESNYIDRLIIWDNILTKQQKRQVLNSSTVNSNTKHHIVDKYSTEMSDEVVALILECMSLYRKSSYFETKVYPKYVRYISKIISGLSHYELLDLMVPQWLQSEKEKLQLKLENGGIYRKTKHVTMRPSKGRVDNTTSRNMSEAYPRVNIDTYDGRIVFYVCMAADADLGNPPRSKMEEKRLETSPDGGMRNARENASHNNFRIQGLEMMHNSYNVREERINPISSMRVDNTITKYQHGIGSIIEITNTLFDVDEEHDMIIPNMNIKCEFDLFPPWLQYMILSDPLPVVKTSSSVTTRYDYDIKQMNESGYCQIPRPVDGKVDPKYH